VANALEFKEMLGEKLLLNKSRQRSISIQFLNQAKGR
jgi:hypothetical protein